MKIEDMNTESLYIYPYYSSTYTNFKVGRATRINTKSVVFDYYNKIDVKYLDHVKELSPEETEAYMQFVLFQDSNLKDYKSLLNKYRDLYEKCKNIQEITSKYEELSVDWSKLQEQIDTFTEEIKKITEPMIKADGHTFYLTFEGNHYRYFVSEEEGGMND